MTSPVTDDDVVQGAATWLHAHSAVTSLLGVNPDGTPMLFQYLLGAEMEGTQSTALVVSCDGGWATPNPHNTLRFPRLNVQIYVDPLRDAGGNVADPPEAQRRIDLVFRTVDRHLHRPQSGIQMWGDIRTLSCARLTEPTVYAVPDGDGLLRSLTTYAVVQG